jgi:hypothetical protein
MNKLIFIKVAIVVGALFLITTILPALLSASNDIAVFIGTIIVIALIVAGFMYHQPIIDFFKGENLDEESN